MQYCEAVAVTLRVLCFRPGPGGRSHLTWLQRQQQKLRERREVVLRSARQPQEARLLSELRSLHQHHSHSASRRLDGYTSDTTMFNDEVRVSSALH